VPPGAWVPSMRTRSGRRQRMTTSATRQGTERIIAEREAWEAYRESLRDLEGADYEEAERISWARLQGTLRELSAAATAN
jgi:DNA-binding PadR family transcriptional regulator